METLVIKTQEQAESLVNNNLLSFDGHIIFECVIEAGGSIEAGIDWGIYCGLAL